MSFALPLLIIAALLVPAIVIDCARRGREKAAQRARAAHPKRKAPPRKRSSRKKASKR